MSALVAGVLAALVLGVVVLGRALGRVGPAWLRPAHAPLWGVAGALVALGVALLGALVPQPAEALARALRVAADGPGARVTHLALALTALLMMAPVVRIAFAFLRRRRLDRAPVPSWSRLFGVGPDGRPLAALRVRLFVPALALALGVAAAGAFAPRGVDTTMWAALVALITAGALAVAPWPREAERPSEAAAATEAPAPEGPDPLPELLRQLRSEGVSVRSERREAIAGPARLPARVLAAAREADAPSTIAEAPLGAGKTAAALEVARAYALDGREVLWIAADAELARAAITRFAALPEAVLLPALRALVPREVERLAADPHAHARFDRVIVDDVDLMTGAELAALRRDLATLAPDARTLVLGVGAEVVADGRQLGRAPHEVVKLLSHEPAPSAEVERHVVERLPTSTPAASRDGIPRAIVRVLGPRDAHRFLEAPPRYTTPMRELLAVDGRAERLRTLAPSSPRALVPTHVEALATIDATATAPRVTPVRTTEVRVARVASRARHRYRGPLELELWEARVELRRTTGGERAHGHDQRRAHTRLAEGIEAPAVVVDARVLVLPTADAIVLHTLVHVVRDLLPWFFRDADRVLGVTSAGPAELGLPDGALVVHELAGAGGGGLGAIGERDWEAVLEAARALLAGCDCAAACARCCESPRCTSTPHNVELDRHRAVALLDALLVPGAAPLARKVA